MTPILVDTRPGRGPFSAPADVNYTQWLSEAIDRSSPATGRALAYGAGQVVAEIVARGRAPGGAVVVAIGPFAQEACTLLRFYVCQDRRGLDVEFWPAAAQGAPTCA